MILPPLNKLPLTLTSFYPPWQPNSYIILLPLNKLPPHSYTILSPWQPTITWQFQSGGLIPKKNPPIAAHCSPLLHGIFTQGVLITLTSFHPL